VEVEVPWISDDYIWNMAFDFKGLATNKWKFTGMLDLDAVCGCFHFKTKSLTPRLSPERKAAEILKRQWRKETPTISKDFRRKPKRP
jgi:hypothetical protein